MLGMEDFLAIRITLRLQDEKKAIKPRIENLSCLNMSLL